MRIGEFSRRAVKIGFHLIVFIIFLAAILNSSTAENNTVDFDNWPVNTVYNQTQINKDFPNGVATGGYLKPPAGNFVVKAGGKKGNCLTHAYPGIKDYSAKWYASIEPHESYTAEWWVRFSSDMDFKKSGKMLGFAEHRVDHNQADGNGGYSCRVSWFSGTTNNTTATMYAYAYHMDHPEGKTDVGQGWYSSSDYIGGYQVFQRNTWYRIKLHVERNTDSKRNGVMMIWINDIMKFEKRDFRWCTDNSNWDTFDFTWHQGGSSESIIEKGTVFIDEIRYWDGLEETQARCFLKSAQSRYLSYFAPERFLVSGQRLSGRIDPRAIRLRAYSVCR
jgi:hypothetical protein